MNDRATQRSDLLMPVPDDKVVHLLEIEALRGITDALKSIKDDAKEDRRLLHEIHAKVIRIEAAKVEELIGPLATRVDSLERDKDRRDGAAGTLDWLVKNWFSLASLFVVIFVILKANGRI